MQITCQHCSNNFDNDVPAYAQGEGSVVCPSCGRDTPAVDSWAALGGGDLFGGGGAAAGAPGGGGGDARVYCFNCGKAMSPREGELIPVCDECRQDAGRADASTGAAPAVGDTRTAEVLASTDDEPIADWMIRKGNGNVYGPFPNETIVEWIQGKKINPDEEVAHIGGAWRLFGQHEEFGRYFEGSSDLTMGTAGTQEIDFRRRSPLRDALRSGGRGIVAVVLLGAIGVGAWILISNDVLVVPESAINRVADRVSDSTRHDDAPLKSEDATALLEQLRTTWPNLDVDSGSSMEHFLRGRTAMLQDGVSDLARAREHLEKAVVLDSNSALALGSLAELYSLQAYRGEASLDLQRQAIYLIQMAEQQNNYTSETARAKAAWLIYSGNYAEGASGAQSALQSNPADPSLHYLLGVAAAAQTRGVGDAARGHFDKTLEIDPGYHQVYFELAKGQEEVGNLRAAIELYDKKIALDPRAAEAHTRLGIIYLRVGDSGKASAHFDQAITINAMAREAVLNRAVLAYQLDGAPGPASTLLAALIAEGGPDLKIRERKEVGVHLSAAHRLAGDPDAALAAIETVLKEDKNYSSGLFHKGLALMDKGEPGASIPLFSRAMDGDLTPLEQATIYFWQGQASGAAGQPQDALESYERAIETEPTFVPAYLWKAGVALDQGDPASAARAVLEHVGRDPLAYARVRDPGLFFQPLPDLAPLVEALEKAAGSTAFDPALFAATGIVQFHAGNLREARSWLSKARDQDDRNEGAAFYLGLVEYRGHQHVAASALFRALITLVHNRGVYHVYMADTLLEQGKVDDAVAAYEKGHGYGANSPWSHSRLAEAFARRDEDDRAREEIDKAIALDPTAVAPRMRAFQLSL